MRESEYLEMLESFLTESAAMFQETGNDNESELRSTLAKYLGNGLDKGISQGELIDFLGVSSPSVLDEAGYSEVEQEYSMSLLGELTDAEIQLHTSGQA